MRNGFANARIAASRLIAARYAMLFVGSKASVDGPADTNPTVGSLA
jgi:hypothetical protein